MTALSVFSLPFFFQAEDGIRDGHVTGVQTCALPIFGRLGGCRHGVVGHGLSFTRWRGRAHVIKCDRSPRRSEERRVGKECRARWAPDHKKKKGYKSSDEGGKERTRSSMQTPLDVDQT